MGMCVRVCMCVCMCINIKHSPFELKWRSRPLVAVEERTAPAHSRALVQTNSHAAAQGGSKKKGRRGSKSIYRVKKKCYLHEAIA